jgi:hypothetical protein
MRRFVTSPFVRQSLCSISKPQQALHPRAIWATSPSSSETQQTLDDTLVAFQQAQGQGKTGGKWGDTAAGKSASLQKRMVERVLFVCNDYNSYTFEEEGKGIQQHLLTDTDITLRRPPIIERVASGAAALQRLEEENFDMVVSLLRVDGDDGSGSKEKGSSGFLDEIKRRAPGSCSLQLCSTYTAHSWRPPDCLLAGLSFVNRSPRIAACPEPARTAHH